MNYDSPLFLRLVSEHLDRRTAEVVRKCWKLLDINDLDGTQDVFLDAVVASVGRLHADGVRMALKHIRAVADGDSIDEVRDVFDVEAVRTSARTQGPVTVKRHISKGVAPTYASEQGMVSTHAAMSRVTENSVRRTIQKTADANKNYGWQRHASADACDFCRMLAGRGAVYKSSDIAAGHEYHDRCHCTAEYVKKGSSQENKDDGTRVKTSNVGTHGKSVTSKRNRRIYKTPRSKPIAQKPETVDDIQVGVRKNDVPSLFDGTRLYESLEKTPKMKNASTFAREVSKTNPNYRRKNPQWESIFRTKTPYDVNCVRCSMALQLRKRGYKVTAGAGLYTPKDAPKIVRLWSPKGSVWVNGQTISWLKHWRNADGYMPSPGSVAHGGRQSNKQTQKNLENEPINSSGVVSWSLKGAKYGHIVCWEKTKKGELLFWDGQSGQSLDKLPNLDKIRKDSLQYFRLDNFEPDDGILDVISIPAPED